MAASNPPDSGSTRFDGWKTFTDWLKATPWWAWPVTGGPALAWGVVDIESLCGVLSSGLDAAPWVMVARAVGHVPLGYYVPRGRARTGRRLTAAQVRLNRAWLALTAFVLTWACLAPLAADLPGPAWTPIVAKICCAFMTLVPIEREFACARERSAEMMELDPGSAKILRLTDWVCLSPWAATPSASPSTSLGSAKGFGS